jgi:hypothetical protein
MNNHKFNILKSMIQDNDDGFVCWEIIEPYVNSNLEKELSDITVMDILREMVDEELIEHFLLDENGYVSFSGDVSASSWFNVTGKGKHAYNNAN